MCVRQNARVGERDRENRSPRGCVENFFPGVVYKTKNPCDPHRDQTRPRDSVQGCGGGAGEWWFKPARICSTLSRQRDDSGRITKFHTSFDRDELVEKSAFDFVSCFCYSYTTNSTSLSNEIDKNSLRNK